MKLWIKMAITFTILINVIIQITLFIIIPRIEENSFTLIGEKLKAIAAASSSSIDGDEYQKLNFSQNDVVNSPLFNTIREHLITTKNKLELSEDIYTLNLVDSNKAIFGVMTNSRLFPGHILNLSNGIARQALINSYREDKCVYTELYVDDHGEWISGLAPIMNSENKVVGVVQVDHSAATVYAKIAGIEKMILWLRIILFFATILLSVLVARYFFKPIEKIVKIINKVSTGDYSENKRVHVSGELKGLLNATENLRITILEQQDKIFNTMTELRNAKEKAESSDRMKSEFLALLSHEVRTPLNVILGNVEVIKLELDENKLTELDDLFLGVKYGSERLIRTVEMIVLYSEIASGSYRVIEKPLNINQTFFRLVETFKKAAEENGVNLKTDCAASTSIVRIDERLFEESIKQVIDNAIKFSKGGEIKFCLIDSRDFGIAVLVEDNGIGISDGFMKELYKPFKQEDMSLARGYEGNGLGLALAKKCSDANGLKITIVSQKNKGTTVEIHIPKEKFFNV